MVLLQIFRSMSSWGGSASGCGSSDSSASHGSYISPCTLSYPGHNKVRGARPLNVLTHSCFCFIIYSPQTHVCEPKVTGREIYSTPSVGKNVKTHRKGRVGTGRDERLGQKNATYYISFVFQLYVYYFISSFGPELCGQHSAN